MQGYQGKNKRGIVLKNNLTAGNRGTWADGFDPVREGCFAKNQLQKQKGETSCFGLFSEDRATGSAGSTPAQLTSRLGQPAVFPFSSL